MDNWLRCNDPDCPHPDCDCWETKFRFSQENVLRLEAEVERLSIKENEASLSAEDIDCLHLCLDDRNVPRNDAKGAEFSMWGRVLRLLESV